jgi:hypothetical protein
MKNLIRISVIIMLASLAFAACKKSAEPKQQEPNEPKVQGPVETVKDVKLTLNYTLSSGGAVPASFPDTFKRAQELLAQVFSSKDFRDELYKRNFHDSAYSKSSSTCFSKAYGGPEVGKKIAGKSVYDNLLANNSISITINIKNNGTNTTTMGSAAACAYRITTYDYWLKLSEKRLAQRMARHFAHEFTHIRGYRHDSNVPSGYKWGSSVTKDPAYGVGDVVGTVLDKWTEAGIIK